MLLVGPSGSGKSTFARRCFTTTEIVSSDACRALVADDETDQAATPAAFEVLRLIVAKRLEARRLTVIDATNVRAEDRRGLVELARTHHALAVAIVFDVGEEVCHARNRDRPDRQFGPHVVRNQAAALRRSLKGLGRKDSASSTAWRPRRRPTRPKSSAGRCGPTGAPRPGPSTSSATSTAATTSWSGCCATSATWLRTDPSPGWCRRPGARPCSSATWSTAAPRHPRCCASSWA